MPLNDLQKAFLKNILVSKDGIIDPETGEALDWEGLSGGGSSEPLKPATLAGTYDDDFDGPTLNAKWTRRSRGAGAGALEIFHNSSMVVPGLNGAQWGDTQSFADADEFEIRMGATYLDGGVAQGFGPVVLNAAGTGIWMGHRETSRLGFFTMTTFATATEPTGNVGGNLGINGAGMLNLGQRAVWSLLKRKCMGTDLYFGRWSFDGVTWNTWYPVVFQPSSFTPQLIGWWKGLQAAGVAQPTLHWFAVVDRLSLSANRCTTPTSGTFTWTTTATSPTGTLANLSNASLAAEVYFSNTNAADVYFLGTWSVAQNINRVRFYSRASDVWGTGYIETSDGTKTPFVMPYAAQWMFVDLPAAVSTTYVKVVWTKGGNYGANPGLVEVEAYLAS